MLVRERMTSPAVSVTPETPFQDALKLMRDKKFRRLPVVDATGKVVGIVSERDMLHASPSPATSLSVWEVNYLLWKLKVSDIMTHNVVTINHDVGGVFNRHILDGGEHGLRLTVQVPTGSGTLAKLSSKITELGGLILSVGTMDRESDGKRELIVKVQGVTKDTLIPALEAIGDHVVDAREV